MASAIGATAFSAGNVVSIGLVANIITTAIRYQFVSGITTGRYTTLTANDSVGFVTGMGGSLIVAAIITFARMFASNLRGSERKDRTSL